jgi:serine protease Do
MSGKLIALATCVCAALWAGPPVAAERAVVKLTDGSQAEGEVLKKDQKTLHLLLGGQVVTIQREDVEEVLTVRGEEEKPRSVEEGAFYKTGQLPVRPVSALARELGPAVVTVRTPLGLGTGWFCSPAGYVVTNHHVVAGETAITVTAFRHVAGRFEKETYRKVRLIALDEDLDLALLKVEEDIGFEVPQLYVGDSSVLREGEVAFTIGNPMGLERSTAEGIISKVNRALEGRLYVQTTAPIAPGNSGGPLFNECGEVIGVVNMGYVYLDGLGFAIPSGYVREFLDNVEAFAYDPDNPNAGIKYMETPVATTDGAITFTEAEFIRTGTGVSCLELADMNGDDIQEVVFVNNRKGEMGVLRLRREGEREPTTDDIEDVNRLPASERFKLVTHAVNNKIGALAVEDMNGDGRLDVLFHGDIDGLAVLEQEEDGTFSSPRKVDDVEVVGRRGAIKVADLDGDGTNEVVTLGPKELTVFTEGADRETFPLNATFRDRILRFELDDVDEDGRLDAVFLASLRSYAGRVLRQDGQGRFVEERMLPCHLAGPVEPLHPAGGGREFVALDRGQNRVRRLSFRTRAQPERMGRLAIAPRAVALGEGAGAAAEFEAADLNGDGLLDIVTVNAADNEFLVLAATPQGYALQESPSPKSVCGLAAYQVDAEWVLFSASVDDGLFGASRVGVGGVAFPRPINTAGVVQTLWLAELDGVDTLVWLEKEDKDYYLRAAPAESVARLALAEGEGSFDIEAGELLFGESADDLEAVLTKKPAHVSFADLNDDGLSDAIVYWSYSGKESLYLGMGEGRFRAVITEQEFLEEQREQPLLVADIDGDGGEDVLFVRPGFVRVLRVDAKDKLYVERQFNWEFGEVARLAPFGESTPPRFLALTQGVARVVEFDLDESRFSLVATIDLAGIESGELEVADFDADGEPDVLIVGPSALQVLYQRDEVPELYSEIVFDADLEHFTYWRAYPADLDGDGADEVLLFDSRRAMFEVHEIGADGMLRPLLRHRLFEKTVQQYDESDALELPRELAIGDVDGNGKADLVFVLHNHIAIYLQSADAESGPRLPSRRSQQGRGGRGS